MATRKRRKSRRRQSNPEYSDAVFDLANEFIECLDKASNVGHKIAQKIQTKAGNVDIAESIARAADALGDLSEDLTDKLDG